MITVVKKIGWAVPLLLLLSACGDKPQELGVNKSDGSAYQGVGASKFASPGWKAGDKNAWEQHLKVRAQSGQNEYSKSN
ncbi:MAG: hypothetical protein ACKVOO_01300 [Burkholderiaceae bacterium]